MLEIDISLFITGDNPSISIGYFYETLLTVGTFEILDPSFNANVNAAVLINTVLAYGEDDYTFLNNTSAFMKLKIYKPPVSYQFNEKYILDVQSNFININGEPRLTQAIISIQIPEYITMDYPKSLKIMTSQDFDPSFNYMTGSYYITPHLTALPAYPAPTASLIVSSNSVQSGGSVILTPTFSNLFGGTANITAGSTGSTGSTGIFNNVVSGVQTASAPVISSNTTYTLTATNISNASATATQTVTITSPPANTGWYGKIVIELKSMMGNANNIRYTIYKGSSTASPVLVSNQNIYSNGFNSIVASPEHELSIDDRLENTSSTFLVTITYFSARLHLGTFNTSGVTNGTAVSGDSMLVTIGNLYNITPGTIPNNVTLRFTSSPDD